MNKKAILITGAASGIGRATALLFSEHGWYVGLYDVNKAALADLSEELGPQRCCSKTLDVTDTHSVKAAISHFAAHTTGRMDVLFNCAGILQVGPFDTVSLAKHHQTIDVNFKGVLNCAFESLPHLISTPDSRMISMASASALYGTPDFASYSATKFAVKGLTEALSLEWQQYNIIVSDILPPVVDTPMVRNNPPSRSMDKLGAFISPADVAEAVWDAANGNKIHWPVSIKFKILYTMSKFLPEWANRLMMRFVSGY